MFIISICLILSFWCFARPYSTHSFRSTFSFPHETHRNIKFHHLTVVVAMRARLASLGNVFHESCLLFYPFHHSIRRKLSPIYACWATQTSRFWLWANLMSARAATMTTTWRTLEQLVEILQEWNPCNVHTSMHEKHANAMKEKWRYHHSWQLTKHLTATHSSHKSSLKLQFNRSSSSLFVAFSSRELVFSSLPSTKLCDYLFLPWFPSTSLQIVCFLSSSIVGGGIFLRSHCVSCIGNDK